MVESIKLRGDSKQKKMAEALTEESKQFRKEREIATETSFDTAAVLGVALTG